MSDHALSGVRFRIFSGAGRITGAGNRSSWSDSRLLASPYTHIDPTDFPSSPQVPKVRVMTIAEKIDKDYLEAYKAHEKTRLGTLRLLKTAAKNRQVELMRPLTDEDYLDVLLKQAKQRQDSIEQYRNAGRNDLADAEAAELEVLRDYLPQTLSPEELDAAVTRAVEPLLDGGMKMMGKAIQAVMAAYKGRVDGKTVSDAVKARFQAAGH